MSSWLQRTGTAVTLSVVTLLLFLERIALDFRYVSLEFEAVDAVTPFTAPYVVISFVIFGAWIWGLLAAVQDGRGGLIAMLVCNLIALALGVSTVLFLCPTPCQTGAPLADHARRLGARILPGVPLTGIALHGGRVSAALTPRGRIATRLLIIAAGVWSPRLERMAGLELPVQPLKGTVLVTEPHVGLLSHFVTEAIYSKTVKATTHGIAARQKQASVAAVLQNLPSGQILIGSSREFAGFDRTVNPQLIARMAKRACRLIPKLERLRLIRAYAGLRPWTPDGRPTGGGQDSLHRSRCDPGRGTPLTDLHSTI